MYAVIVRDLRGLAGQRAQARSNLHVAAVAKIRLRAAGWSRRRGRLEVWVMRTYEYDRLLQWSECDAGGIIFFPNYARWMVDGLNQMLLSLGIDPNGVIDAATRGGLPVAQLAMHFHHAPQLHETVRHEITVEKIGRKSIAFRHRFLLGDLLCMEATETRIWATHSLTQPPTLTTLPVPDHVRAALSADS